MPRPKSILQKIEIDKALKAHNCQYNKNHRIKRADTRLKLTKNRSYDHYCKQCAIDIVERDITKLNSLLQQLKRTLS